MPHARSPSLSLSLGSIWFFPPIWVGISVSVRIPVKISVSVRIPVKISVSIGVSSIRVRAKVG